MVIPLLIFMPYYQKFDFSAYNFELIYLYDDIWFANMVMENQQILAQNKWDFVWKIVPHLSIYGSLNSLRALIRPPSTLSSRVYCAVSQVPHQQPVAPLPRADVPGYAAQNDTRDQFGESEDGDPFQPPPKPPKLVPKFPVIHEGRLLSAPSRGVISHDLSFLDDITGPPSHLPSRYSRMIQTVITLILFTAGTAILVLHLRAAWKAFSTDVISCTTMTRPWFASKVSCSTVRHNCHMHNSTEVTNEDLSMIEPSSVAALVFSHCPMMFVPTVITEFHNLLGIDFFNCTLYEWTEEAAITAQAHPRLTYIILIRVNMTRLPDGVLQPLPDTMTDFEISVSNLTELPPDLHERWKPMSIFYVEHALLTEFPPTLMHLRVSDLSLIGNQIDRLPEFNEDAAFVSFAMTHTPLTELPKSMGDVSKLAFLDLAYTRLASFPIWMKEVAATATKINIHHTPFCESMSSQEIEENYGDNAVMCCLSDMDVRQSGKYPLQILAPNRLYDDPKMVPKTTTPISKADLYG